MSQHGEGVNNPLLTLLELGHRARTATGAPALAFLLVNDTRDLLQYREALLWFAEGGVRAVSGILQLDRNTPYIQWVNRLSQTLTERSVEFGALTLHDAPGDIAADWPEWFPMHALWVPLPFVDGDGVTLAGGLVLTSNEPWPEETLALLREWSSIWLHEYQAQYRPMPWSWHQIKKMVKQNFTSSPDMPWWKRRSSLLAMAAVFIALFPVRLTVMAQGELVPVQPAVIRAPLEGVIGQVLVRPNQTVKVGDVLFVFDEAALASRHEVARQALSSAEAEYRQLTQLALSDSRSKSQLSTLLGKVAEKQAEANFLESQLERTKVLAPQDGVALFDDPMEWIGRPVQTGERVMRVANPADLEIEAWVQIGDAIPLPEHADLDLYLSASPFSSVAGRLRYMAHDAQPRPDGTYGYRVRASLLSPTEHRLGLKGTAKIHGGWVPMLYWVLRRPLATIRQFVAL